MKTLTESAAVLLAAKIPFFFNGSEIVLSEAAEPAATSIRESAADAVEAQNPAPNTVLYWLGQIPDEKVRERAIRCCEYPTCFALSASEALGFAFYWSKTREGFDYWNEQQKKIEKEED